MPVCHNHILFFPPYFPKLVVTCETDLGNSPFVCLPIYLFTYLSICFSVCVILVFFRSSFCLFINLSIYQFIFFFLSFLYFFSFFLLCVDPTQFISLYIFLFFSSSSFSHLSIFPSIFLPHPSSSLTSFLVPGNLSLLAAHAHLTWAVLITITRCARFSLAPLRC